MRELEDYVKSIEELYPQESQRYAQDLMAAKSAMPSENETDFITIIRQKGYFCPLSNDILIIPFTVKLPDNEAYSNDADGKISDAEKNNSFEKAIMQLWISAGGKHPITRRDVNLSTCYVNHALMHEISEFVKLIEHRFSDEVKTYFEELNKAQAEPVRPIPRTQAQTQNTESWHETLDSIRPYRTNSTVSTVNQNLQQRRAEILPNRTLDRTLIFNQQRQANHFINFNNRPVLNEIYSNDARELPSFLEGTDGFSLILRLMQNNPEWLRRIFTTIRSREQFNGLLPASKFAELLGVDTIQAMTLYNLLTNNQRGYLIVALGFSATLEQRQSDISSRPRM